QDRRARGADAGRPRLDVGQGRRRGGRAGRGVPRRRGRVAVGRLLDVPGHEPGHAGGGTAQRLYLQPELRGPPGQGRPHPPGVAAGRRRHRRDRPTDRPRPALTGPVRPRESGGAVQPFITHTGRAVSLRRSSVDTDQIIPAEYLKRVSREGFGDGLFAAWRNDPDFVLNQPAADGATILIAGPDFGIGSSREHAVWALLDYGFRVVISARFGDIFYSNSTKAGLIPARMDAADVASLQDAADADPAAAVT